MAISMNKINGNETIKGFAANKQLRNAINARLNKTTIVINKLEMKYNKETKEYEPIVKLGTIGYSPVVEAFGVNREYKRADVPVEIDLDGDTTISRKINIDGMKYVYCDSIMSIECKDKQQIEKLDKDGYEFNGALYRVLGASPSHEKHAVKMYFKVTEEVPTERVAFEIMDKVSGYVYSQGLFSKPVSGKQITKANTRWGNYMTNMQALAEIDLEENYIAIVHGSIDGACDFNEETNAKLRKAGVKIDNNINDGGMYFSTDVVKQVANNVGINMTDKDALRVALQVRVTYITSKCMSRTMTDAQLKQLAAFGKAKFYGNTNGKLMCVVDTDGAKLLNTTALENGKGKLQVNVMAMAKASQPKTSGQHLIKYLYVNPEETLRLISEMTKENLANYIMEQIEEGQGVTYRANLTKALGDEALQNKLLVEGMIKDSFKYIQSAIAKCKLSIPAVYSHMMFDASYALTNGAISGVLGITKDGFVEAYSADVLRMYSAEIAEIENNNELTEEQKDEQLFNLLSGIVIKYPSAGPREYEIVVYKTNRQIRNKIANLGLNNNMAKMLLAYFNNTPFGTTVYAPLNAMKNKLAGADCDFDATMCDMSELKHILINERRKQQETKPGFMGDCTFISYEDIDRTGLSEEKEETTDVLEGAEDIEF